MTRSINVNFRMEAELKKGLEEVCSEMGLNLTTAFTIFAKKVLQERKIPFELTADPFCSHENLSHLKRSFDELKENSGIEHDLLEADQ